MSSRTALAFVSLLTVTAGCASVVQNYRPKAANFAEPMVQAVAVAHIGDNLLRQGTFTQHEAIRFEDDASVGMISSYTVRRGLYLKQGDNGQEEFYRAARSDDGGEIAAGFLSDPAHVLRVAKNAEDQVCVVTIYSAVVCSGNAKFSRTSVEATANSFQQTLIYNGRFGEKINIGYREFSNNFARPAFSNNVEYDLRESNIIGYKGARIEVLESTNQYIRYRVLQHFAR